MIKQKLSKGVSNRARAIKRIMQKRKRKGNRMKFPSNSETRDKYAQKYRKEREQDFFPCQDKWGGFMKWVVLQWSCEKKNFMIDRTTFFIWKREFEEKEGKRFRDGEGFDLATIG